VLGSGISRTSTPAGPARVVITAARMRPPYEHLAYASGSVGGWTV